MTRSIENNPIYVAGIITTNQTAAVFSSKSTVQKILSSALGLECWCSPSASLPRPPRSLRNRQGHCPSHSISRASQRTSPSSVLNPCQQWQVSCSSALLLNHHHRRRYQNRLSPPWRSSSPALTYRTCSSISYRTDSSCVLLRLGD